MYYPSGLFRLKARKALKGHWQTALLVALVVNLPTLLMQGISAFTGNDAFGRLQNLVIAASRDGQLTNALLQNEVNLILKEMSQYRYDPEKYAERVRERRDWNKENDGQEDMNE